MEKNTEPTTIDWTVDEIESKMQTHGFAEMRWLWRRFVASGLALDDIDDVQLTERRNQHMGALTNNPLLMVMLSMITVVAVFWYLGEFVMPTESSTVDQLMRMVFSVLTIYLFWFIICGIHWTNPIPNPNHEGIRSRSQGCLKKLYELPKCGEKMVRVSQ